MDAEVLLLRIERLEARVAKLETVESRVLERQSKVEAYLCGNDYRELRKAVRDMENLLEHFRAKFERKYPPEPPYHPTP